MDSNAVKNKTSYITNSKITFSLWCLVLQYHQDIEEVKTLLIKLNDQSRLEEFLHLKTALGESPMMLVAQKGRMEAVAALMGTYKFFNTPKTNVKAALNEVDKFGLTALMRAARLGQTKTTGLLLKELDPLERDSAICFITDANGENALSLARSEGHKETEEFLISCLSRPELAHIRNLQPSKPPVVFSNSTMHTQPSVQLVETKRKRTPKKPDVQAEKPTTETQPKRKRRTKNG